MAEKRTKRYEDQYDYDYDYLLSENEIKNLDIKELNRRIENSNLSQDNIKELKVMRRKMKRQQYGKDSRKKVRDSMHSLVSEKNQLFYEYSILMKEVEELKETKAKLECYNMLMEMEYRWQYLFE